MLAPIIKCTYCVTLYTLGWSKKVSQTFSGFFNNFDIWQFCWLVNYQNSKKNKTRKMSDIVVIVKKHSKQDQILSHLAMVE